MKLEKRDEDMLRGKYGEAVAKAMEIIVSIAEALDSKRLLDVESVHVSGISVSNIGRAGVELIESFLRMGGRVQVPLATVNPIGYDVFGLLPRDAEEWGLQLRVIKALERMGFRNILSCAPYDYGNRPRRGAHIAWAESSAVLYANSVLGAYTNREGGIIALAAGLTGRIYEWGLHIPEERVPRVRVKIEGRLASELLGGLLGAYLGLYIEHIPLIEGGGEEAYNDEMLVKNLLAAAGAWGSHALIYLPGVTPNYTKMVNRVTATTRVSISELKKLLDDIGGVTNSPDVIFVGCPHLSFSMVERVLSTIEKCGSAHIPVYVATCGCVDRSIVKHARKLNVYILAGTCPVVTNISRWGVKSIATNSLKAAFYLPRRHNVEVMVGSLNELITLACTVKS